MDAGPQEATAQLVGTQTSKVCMGELLHNMAPSLVKVWLGALSNAQDEERIVGLRPHHLLQSFPARAKCRLGNGHERDPEQGQGEGRQLGPRERTGGRGLGWDPKQGRGEGQRAAEQTPLSTGTPLPDFLCVWGGGCL